MNKRGDISVTILVIGVFAICSLAILSFHFSIDNLKTKFVGIGLIENMNSIVEQIKFDRIKNFGQFSEPRVIEESKEIKIYVNGNNIVGEYITSSGFWRWKKEVSLIKVEYVMPG